MGTVELVDVVPLDEAAYEARRDELLFLHRHRPPSPRYGGSDRVHWSHPPGVERDPFLAPQPSSGKGGRQKRLEQVWIEHQEERQNLRVQEEVQSGS